MDLSPPPCTHLLLGNDPPPDAEISSLLAFLDKKRSQLAALDFQIDDSRSSGHVVKSLVAERDATADCIRSYAAILSPVRRMPNELLAEIFSWTSFTRRVRTASWYTHFRDVYSPPWILGHICRSWRVVALGTPFLWRTIHISCPYRHESPALHIYPLSFLECQLLRSANLTLDVSVEWREENEGPPATVLLSKILAESHRWRKFFFELHFPATNVAIYDLIQSIRNRIPALENFEFIDRAGAYHWHSIKGAFSFLSDAPSLRRVVLTDLALSVGSAPLDVPWAQITHYHGKHPCPRQLDILSAAHNLVECRLTFFDLLDHPAPDDSKGGIHLPQLRRLVTSRSRVLHYLTASSLQFLQVQFDPDSTPFHTTFPVLLEEFVVDHMPDLARNGPSHRSPPSPPRSRVLRC
ncbi:hypothetical protein FB45DRAFT_1094175 [Roridomyces roridus]|uniref:F-box domain-containing protein n=1 Tax=Roridomyces roridus TaxID=1738132 RepID=A0AAD7FI62_9AGAR|nr:hypothetical protein FB45DRAFT_1094175 [Roridomyces roridus]